MDTSVTTSIFDMRVIKRDGSFAVFESSRIFEAILKAGNATGGFGEDLAHCLCDEVVEEIEARARDNHEPFDIQVETIQDIIEEALYRSVNRDVFLAYHTYREKHKELRQSKKAIIDAVSTIDEYVQQSDWRVKANSNQGYSLGGMILNVSGKVTANYWLNRIYDEEIADAHRRAFFHIHDLDMLSGYCAGWSLRQLLTEGFNGVPGKIESRPPKHLSSALGQMVNFLGTLQNEFAGAQAFSSFDTYLAPYVRIDKLEYSVVLKHIQEFIYNLNVPSRWGTQTPFTNITFDWVCPDDLKSQTPIIGGKEADFTYGELEEEMALINRAYMEVMTKGDAKGRVFTFPIPTYNMTPDFPWESENANRLFEMTAKYGLPYFQNFLNSDLTPNMVRSMCPLEPTTEVIVRISGGTTTPMSKSILDIVRDIARSKIRYEVYYKNHWCPVTGYTEHYSPTRSIFLVNGAMVEMGVGHIQPVMRGGKWIDIPASEIDISDLIPVDHNVSSSTLSYVSIETIIENPDPKYLYCVSVGSDEHYFTLENGIITHNCRLQLDLRELLKRGNGLFGSAEQTGSIGVVTLNLARLGYLCEGDFDKLFGEITHYAELAKKSLEIKRRVLTELMDQDFYPFAKRYLGTWRNHFSTIGVNGMNEMILNFTNGATDITSEEGQQIAIDVLNHIRDLMVKFQEETGHLYNLEATPAEGAMYRFAKADQKDFGQSIIQAGTIESPYYTNSSQLPASYTNDPFEALIHQDPLQVLYTGGTVLHTYTSNKLTAVQCKEFVKTALTNFRLPYLTVTAIFSVCPDHGYHAGEISTCPSCGKDMEIYSRTMGYYRPRSEYNVGKAQEHRERINFDIE